MSREGGPGYPRPLQVEERDLIEALLGAVRSGVGRYIGQLESLVVVGGCRCLVREIAPQGEPRRPDAPVVGGGEELRGGSVRVDGQCHQPP